MVKGIRLELWHMPYVLPGVKYGGLFYQNLKRCKNLALKYAKGNYEKSLKLTLQAKEDLS